MMEMYESGELQQVLGAGAVSAPAPRPGCATESTAGAAGWQPPATVGQRLTVLADANLPSIEVLPPYARMHPSRGRSSRHGQPQSGSTSTRCAQAADRAHAQRLPRRRRRAPARQAAAARTTRACAPPTSACSKGPRALPGQALRPAGDGPPVRRAAQLPRGARRRASASSRCARTAATRWRSRRCCCSARRASARRTSRASCRSCWAPAWASSR